MLASRFVVQFQEEVDNWQKQLANVADAFVFIGEIQRTWSYLEPLFIGSEEVKRELPEDAKRFAGIDSNVKNELKTAWETKSVKVSCNNEGLLKRFEGIQEQLGTTLHTTIHTAIHTAIHTHIPPIQPYTPIYTHIPTYSPHYHPFES